MEPTFSPVPSEDIVLYDDDCGFCSSAVAFIRANDPAARFRYVPLESPEGRERLIAGGRDPAAKQALCLADDAGLHAASDAALRIAGRLRAPWPQAARLAGLVPRAVREAVYRGVARSRYRLPG
jgi:predicted DCC family thiol-disulfide oxidoreductase YuxK